jgi:hypothetical protein
MRLDQIAFYCVDEAAVKYLKQDLNLASAAWITDTVTGFSKVRHDNGKYETGQNVAELQFCYSLGIELEIIRYIDGPHWHPRPLANRFISHVGIHLDDGEAFPVLPHSRAVQETKTISHTSEYLTKPGSPGYGRTYQYRIYQIGPMSYVKYIMRIPPK